MEGRRASFVPQLAIPNRAGSAAGAEALMVWYQLWWVKHDIASCSIVGGCRHLLLVQLWYCGGNKMLIGTCGCDCGEGCGCGGGARGCGAGPPGCGAGRGLVRWCAGRALVRWCAGRGLGSYFDYDYPACACLHLRQSKPRLQPPFTSRLVSKP